MHELREAANIKQLVAEDGFVNGEIKPELYVPLPEEDVSRIWGGDRRLSMFNYTIETINLLVLPMMKTK